MEAVSAPVPTDSKSSSPGGSAWFDVVLPYKRSTFPTGQYLNYLESLLILKADVIVLTIPTTTTTTE
jgi:hypothetical protein